MLIDDLSYWKSNFIWHKWLIFAFFIFLSFKFKLGKSFCFFLSVFEFLFSYFWILLRLSLHVLFKELTSSKHLRLHFSWRFNKWSLSHYSFLPYEHKLLWFCYIYRQSRSHLNAWWNLLKPRHQSSEFLIHILYQHLLVNIFIFLVDISGMRRHYEHYIFSTSHEKLPFFTIRFILIYNYLFNILLYFLIDPSSFELSNFLTENVQGGILRIVLKPVIQLIVNICVLRKPLRILKETLFKDT